MNISRSRTLMVLVIMILAISVTLGLAACDKNNGDGEETTAVVTQSPGETDTEGGADNTESENESSSGNANETETKDGSTSSGTDTETETGKDTASTGGTTETEGESKPSGDVTETENDPSSTDKETETKNDPSSTDKETETKDDPSSTDKETETKEDSSSGGTETESETETEVETVPHVHSYDGGVVVKEPTCKDTGIKRFTCTVCGEYYDKKISVTNDHVYDEGVVIKEPTLNEEGIRLRTCTVCQRTKEEPIEKLPAAYTITIVGMGEYRVDETGKYSLTAPEKVGYKFIKWTTEDGKEFPASGTVSANVTVIPVIEILKTTTVEQLASLAAAGAEKILIAADIVIDRPIFIVDNTTIYSEKNVKLVRSPEYAGDIFVVGIDENDVPSVLMNKNAILTLKSENGSITIDGNRDALAVTVVGSAIFVTDSGTVNIHDGVTIANHAKDGNERAFICTRYVGEWLAKRAGGAAILILKGEVNMYGGVIENNWVRIERTIEVDENGKESWHEHAGCGGAIYNCGNFNMFGGVIRNNEALRGGAIYNDEIVRLYAGEISNNLSHSYGGAIASSSATEAQMFIGTEGESENIVLIKGNVAETGGALYSNTDSPIMILGNTRFEGNDSLYGGGAIYTAGALTVRDTEFIGNTTPSSGGAIYFHYNYKKPDKAQGIKEKVRRKLEIEGCTFEGNTAKLGGAIVLSATQAAVDKEQGTYATIKNSVFKGNSATNCGALYVTRYSEAYLTNVEFVGNTTTGYGGAMSTQVGCIAQLNNVSFKENEANNGGALYVYDSKKITFSNVEFLNNKTTSGNGGAIYLNAIKLTFDSSVKFIGNSSANHGGAIYISYVTREEGVKDGGEIVCDGTVFENNTALSGGAISARTESTVTIKGVTFKNCATPEAKSGTDAGGGAIYSNNSTIDLSNVKFDNCSSGYYGGTMMFHSCQVKMSGIDIENASGGTGAALYVNRGKLNASDIRVVSGRSTVNGMLYIANIVATIDNLTASGNVSVNGGVIYASGAETVVDISNSIFENNTASNGAAIYAVSATVNVKDCEFNKNVANNGGAIFADLATVNVTGNTTFDGNGGERTVEYADGTSKTYSTNNGGAVYLKGSSLTLNKGVSFKNHSVKSNGGAIYSSSKTVSVKIEPEGDGDADPDPEAEEKYEYITYTSVVTVDGAIFEGNSAGKEGGAIYLTTSEYSVSNSDFVGNSSLWCKRGGGAIYSTASHGSLDNVSFINNSSTKGGAVALHSESTLTVSSMTAKGNLAQVIECTCPEETKCTPFGLGGVFYVNSSTLELKEATDSDKIVLGGKGEGEANVAVSGGAIYIEKSGAEPVLNVHGAEFIGNLSTYEHAEGLKNSYGGGAIRAHKANVVLSGVLMEGNTSQYYGGAIHAFYGSMTIDGSTFKDNAGGTGAAIYLNGIESVSVSNSTLSGNKSSANGTLYVANSGITLENVTANDNIAKNGGLLYFSGSASTLSVIGGSYTGNKAIFGGAMYITEVKSVDISGASFKNNVSDSETTAEPNGGAINVVNTKISVKSSTFEGNSTKNHGGAIALVGGEMTLSGDNIFRNNVAGNHGGAINVLYRNVEGEKIGATLVISGGLFEGNKAMGGGAISIRSNCQAEITSTVFKGNSVTGDNGTLDGDSEGGGAIYAGYATLVLDSVEMTGNSSDGRYGGAIDSVYSTVTICGSTKIKNNTNGVFVLGKNLQIKDAVSITDNERSNVYLSKGRRIVLVGDITGAHIGVMANAGAFVVADGINVTDVLVYADCFEGDLAPIYKTENDLRISFDILEQPLSSNSYTFRTMGTPTYQWYVLNGGEWSAVSGATRASLENAIAGNTYKCIATVTRADESISVESISIVYTSAGTQSHAVCGESCAHGTHEKDTWYPVSSAIELLNVGKTGGSYYLTCDIEVDASIVISNNASICLNGYKITAAKSEKQFSILSVKTGSVLNLTDCTKTERVGYFEDRKWTEGAKEGADAVTLKGGIVLGGYATHGGAIYSTGEVNLYNVNLVNNLASNRGGAIYVAAGKVNASNTAFLANGVENNSYGGGAIYMTESEGALESCIMIANHSCKGGAIALHTESTLTVNSLTAEGNYAVKRTYADESTGAEKTDLGIGGFVYLNSSHLILDEKGGDIVIGGSVAASGGAIYAEKNKVVPTISIKGAEFIGNEAGVGGAIYTNSAELVVNGASFSENKSTTGNGGAIYAYKTEVALSDSEFDKNSANGNGGAISVTGSDAVFSGDNLFADNTATNHGGAIYLTYYTDSEKQNIGSVLTMTGGTFRGNSAMGGGAISIRTACAASIESTVFENNSVEGYSDTHNGDGEGGGAIYVGYGDLSLKNVTMSGNTAKDGFGGAVNVLYSSLTVNGGEFTSNSATFGGAINLNHSTEAKGVERETVIVGATFNNNTAEATSGAVSGGAICSASSTLKVTDCTFTSNNVTNGTKINDQHGGAIYANKTTLTVSGTTFTGNTTGYYGGAIAATDSSEVSITGGSVSGSTGQTGAALWFSGCTNVEMTSVRITDNTSVSNGIVYINHGEANRFTDLTVSQNSSASGFIYISGGALNVVGGSFSGNEAKSGGIVCIKGGSVIFNNNGETQTVFEGNSATNGGVIYAEGGSTTVNGVILRGNTAKYGGAIYVSGGNVTLDGVTASANTATNGGAIYVTGGNVTVNGGSLTGNSATKGGAVYAGIGRNADGGLTTIGQVTFNDVTLTSNSATNGGAIYSDGAEVTVHGGSFTGNTATNGHGGAIYVATASYTDPTVTEGDNANKTKYQISAVVIDNGCYFGNNKAVDENTEDDTDLGYGGAIYVTHSTRVGSTVTVTGGKFEGNSAKNGAAIAARTATTVTLNNVELTTNTSDLNGGAIFAGYATVNVNGGSFSENSSTSGGAISVIGDDNGAAILNISGTSFTKNNATANGGAIYVIGSGEIRIENSNFGDTENGNAAQYGGAIALKGKAAIEIIGSKFIGNASSSQGGALRVENSESFKVQGCEFKQNTSKSEGGAIYMNACAAFEIDSTDFEKNASDMCLRGGGAIYMTESVGSVKKVTFTGNSASKGGAIAVHTKSVLTVYSMTAEGNYAHAIECSCGKGCDFGFGGVIFNSYCTVNLFGDADGINMSGNSAVNGGAVYSDGASVNVSGRVIIDGNTANGEASNVVIPSNKGVIIKGELNADTKIGVTTADGEFVWGDGENITDVSGYADKFSHDGGKPVYAESGKLKIGLVITQKPDKFNDFTVNSTADTYKWYLAEDANRENAVCEGAALVGVEEGLSYVCVASFGEHKIETAEVIYYAKHTHPICGETCMHSDSHASVDWYYASTDAELRELIGLGYNVYLVSDIEVSESLTTVGETYLCLNGHILSAAENEEIFSIISVSEDTKLCLTDCDTTERVGYIEEGKWIEGIKDGAEAVTLKGGIVSGGHANLGAAIWAKGDVEIYNVNFVNNIAAERGGAIFAMGALDITGASFVCNEAGLTGGAFHGEGGITFNVTDTEFIANRALSTTHGGGAFYVNTKAVGTLRGSSFIGNTSHRGGAIALHSGSTLTVYSMIARDNTATATDEGKLGVGGVFILNASTLNLVEEIETDEIIIEGNSAVNGGAIYAESSSTVNITGAEFKNNSANLGGAIYANNSAITIGGNAKFTSNSASNNGGAISATTKATVTVSGNVEFADNTAKNHGGAIYLTHANNVGATLTMTGGAFRGNSAMGGGAISIRTACAASIDSTVFENNSVEGYADTHNGDGEGGGAIYVGYGDLSLKNVTMSGNTAAGGFGGAVNVLYSSLTVEGGEFTSNSAMIGGAINLNHSIDTADTERETVIIGAAFNNNTAEATSGAVSGGAIYSASSTLTVTDCTFVGNKATNGSTSNDQHGGAIYANKTTLTVSGTTFTGNTTGYYGGAIAATGSSEVSITGGSISESTGITGAAIWFNSCSSASVNGTAINNNSHNGKVKWGSGTVYISGGSNYTFTDVTAQGNTTNYQGAVFYVSSGKLKIEGGSYSGNSAKEGGALHVSGSANVTVNGAEFNGNTATTNGGAIYVGGGTLTVNNASFTSNVSTNAGGAIYVSGGEVTVNGGSFTSNSVTATDSSKKDNKGGGAICATGAVTVTINGVTMTDNSSGYYGGSISAYDAILHIGADSDGNVTTIENSKGATGAAICYKDGDGDASTGTYTVDGLEVKGTVGTGSGVIYINDGTLSINNLTATNNSSKSGGIIHASGGQSFEVKNSSIELTDTAGAPSGAINLTASGKKLTLEGVTLTGSKAVINATSKAVVEIRHKTEEEKTALTEAIILAGGATISYVDVSAQ